MPTWLATRPTTASTRGCSEFADDRPGLGDDITDSNPGAGGLLYLINSNGERSTIGLDDSGTIQAGKRAKSATARTGEGR